VKISPPELCVVVPTFNESQNVKNIVNSLTEVLNGTAWEVIFVDDDSPDSTAKLVREISRSDYRVRCIQRIGRRGLSTAVVEGALASSAPFIAVMDGDLQHDERMLPRMMEVLKDQKLDIIVGSRYTDGGSIAGWDACRIRISRFACKIGRMAIKADLRDPMSGFFMMTRNAFENSMRRLSGNGFKILIDLFASCPTPLRYAEIPYKFRQRVCGESKLDAQAVWEYGMLILDKMLGRYLPVRFISFSLIGGLGVAIHLASLTLLFKAFGLNFTASQAAATLLAMTFNYALNNSITYRDLRLKGWKWARGWISFVLACSIGAIANVGIASHLFLRYQGWLPAALAGVVVGAVWNYAVTMVYTWNKGK
jgi:dolichol-phosphate mannosyltransferase